MTLPDLDTLDTFGGALVNAGLGVVDPTTDLDADAGNRAFADVAMLTHTADRAFVRFTTSATTPSLVSHDAMWGSDPTYAPTVARTGTGVFTVTWPANVVNELGETKAINIRFVRRPNVEGATLVITQASRTAANIVTVYTFNAAGAANDVAGSTVSVSWV